MDFHIPYQLYRQQYAKKYAALYHALRDSIMKGSLAYGTRIPSSRELAALYGMSRGTVAQVFDMLAADGYLASEAGRGTFVAYRRPPGGEVHKESPVALSAWGDRLQRLPGLRLDPVAGPAIRFGLSRPDPEAFPHEEWNRHLYAQIREMPAMEGTQAALGHYPLREAIARHIRRVRGIDTTAERIAVTGGSMQAIALLAMLLLEPGARAVVEDPGYTGMRRAIQAAGAVAVPEPVDRHGIRPRDWEVRALFVTPSRQYPTGAVLGLERRQRILAWAEERDAVIVEDDYDSEFRHAGRPIEPLKALDAGDRVAYVGTFSKTMLPHLRIGYVVLPAALVEPFRKAKMLFEPQPTGLLEQRALAAFMRSGQYERHLRRMKRIYSHKYDVLRDELRTGLDELFDCVDSEAGLHIFAYWRRSAAEYERFAAECAAAGVGWDDVRSTFTSDATPAVCFGFSHLSVEEIRRGAAIMREVWKKEAGTRD